MKRIVSFVLIFTLTTVLYASCSDNTEESQAKPVPTEIHNEENLVINIYRPPVGDLQGFNDVDSWEEYILGHFGVEININYVSPLHQSAISTGGYYPDAIKEGEVSGLIELNVGDYRNIPILMDQGLILPLDDYLKENEAFLSLSPLVRDAFIMNDGQMWAFTGRSVQALGIRGLRTSWLDALGLEAPSNLDELYGVSKAFAYDDPNGNGMSDEHGMDFNRQAGTRMLLDLFLANDCYISNYGACSIGFDYTTGAYEDAALKPGMADALSYIKSLYTEGILHMNMNYDFADRDGYGNFFDYTNFQPWRMEWAEWTQVYSLKEDPYKSVYALKPTKCFVMASNTEKPKETVETFMNTFLGSAEGIALGSLGVPGSDFTIEDNVITHIYTYEDTYGQSNFYNENIWLTGLNYELLNEMGYKLESPHFQDGTIIAMRQQQDVIESLMIDDMIFTDTFYLPHSDYKKIQTSFNYSVYVYFYDSFDSVDPEEFIDNYLESQKKAGAVQILYEINEKLGVNSTYNYQP